MTIEKTHSRLHLYLGASDLDFPRFFRFYRDRMIVTEEFNSAVKIFIVEGLSPFLIILYDSESMNHRL